MIIDKYNEFSDAQAVTASAESTNVIDTKSGGDAEGKPLDLVIQVDTTATAAGAATVTFALQTDTVENFASPTTLFTTAAIGKASLVAGYEAVKIQVPQGCQRYLRVYYTVATGPLTAGAFSAFLTPGAQTNKNNAVNA